MNSLCKLTRPELIALWQQAWGCEPHRYLSRQILEASLHARTNCRLTPEQLQRLNKLGAAYKRNPHLFEQGREQLKAGTKLVRHWQGKPHTVLVTNEGFAYQNNTYTSLSQVAAKITGTRWNGWAFFGLNNKGNG